MNFGFFGGAEVLIGIGYDVHRLEGGRTMRLGGVDIPDATTGPVAHSDGDVILHALCDALLGAAGLGDIGYHFPDTDPTWKGANSLLFLQRVVKMLAEHGLRPHNVDCMLILERPRIAPYRDRMRRTIADALHLPLERVSVKATTAEGLGDFGSGAGMAAHAVATVDEFLPTV